MSLLFPAMLLGLAGLALPIVLHLIARHKYPVWPFPSIRLLRYEKRDNAFARRLVDPWQLLLRLLVLALLVLAMGRIFLGGCTSAPAPRNVIVVLDTSASMLMAGAEAGDGGGATALERARRVARDLLRSVALPSRGALIAAGDEIRVLAPLGPDPAPALAALEKLQAGCGTGPGLVPAVATACDMLQGRHETRSQIFVLTDRRASAFDTRNQQDLRNIAALAQALGRQLSIVVVDVAGAEAENLAVVEASLRGREVRIGDDAHILARVRNFGKREQVARLTLTAAGKQEPPSRDLAIEPAGEVLVDLTAQINRSAHAFAGVALQAKDAMPQDNFFSVPFTVASSRRILIVNGAASATSEASVEATQLAGLAGAKTAAPAEGEIVDGATILQYALNPGRELGLAFGTGIDTTRITPEALPAQTLSRYEVVVLYDVSRLSEESLADLRTFVQDGRALLIVCAASLNPMEFNASLAAAGKQSPALAPAQIGNDLILEPPVGIDLWDTTSGGGAGHSSPGPWLLPFRDARQGDLTAVRFHRIREIRDVESGASVLMFSTGGQALAVEAQRGQGRVILLSYGLELSRGNIAMTKAFPLLTWRLVDYLTGQLRFRPPDLLAAATPAVLDVSDSAFRFSRELELSPAEEERFPAAGEPVPAGGGPVAAPGPRTLSVSDQETVFVDGLPAGRYWLHKKQSASPALGIGYARPVAVNLDARESGMGQASESELRRLFGESVTLAAADKIAGLVPRGAEAWRLLIVVLVLAYFAEAAFGYVTGRLRDRRAEAEQSVAQPGAGEGP